MDSYSLYIEICRNARRISPKERLLYVEEMVKCIKNEVFTEPYSVKKSSFIQAVVEMINSKIARRDYANRAASDISIVDAHVILEVLLEELRGNSGQVIEHYRSFSEYLFCGKRFFGNMQEEMETMVQIVREIIVLIRKKAEEAQAEAKEQSEIKEEAEADTQSENTEKAEAVAPKPPVIDEKRNALLEQRVQSNKESVQKWHEEMRKTRESLMELQPSVSKLLEGFMNFSDSTTQNYVLQFAKGQIELYDLISDNYLYHKERIKENANEDYINAVQNYEDFLYTIADGLSLFGIEEISSVTGDVFDGKLHEADRNDFSSRTAIIKESVRSGFRYEDIIIQKEKVMI